MNWMQFIVELVEALAWPILVFIAVFQLRDSINEVIPRLLRIKHKDTEIEFGKLLDAIETKAEFVEKLPRSTDEKTDESEHEFKSIAELSRRSAIVQAWAFVDRELLRLLRTANIQPKERGISVSQSNQLLLDCGFNEEDINTFRQIKAIAAVTMTEKNVSLTRGEVTSYIDVAFQIARKLKNVRQHLTAQ